MSCRGKPSGDKKQSKRSLILFFTTMNACIKYSIFLWVGKQPKHDVKKVKALHEKNAFNAKHEKEAFKAKHGAVQKDQREACGGHEHETHGNKI